MMLQMKEPFSNWWDEIFFVCTESTQGLWRGLDLCNGRRGAARISIPELTAVTATRSPSAREMTADRAGEERHHDQAADATSEDEGC